MLHKVAKLGYRFTFEEGPVRTTLWQRHMNPY
jgi:hypothetical protein